jgi:hypothetical protein
VLADAAEYAVKKWRYATAELIEIVFAGRK